ncbi:MAG: LLM class flavin-dependent oxidoreductase [Acidimicrobiia bacterium]|nr:LLM class flavin-dependent oxidoreductase [Acidimicrobiia bacterium]
MDLAISPSTPGLSAAELVELCVVAEDLGYAAAWTAEVAGPGTFALLGAVAARTRRLDLGVAVVAAATRSPALLAMEAATVSQLLGDRVMSLGIGSSSQFILDAWHAAPFDPALARVRETVEATRVLLGGGREYRGDVVRVSRFALSTSPSGPVRLCVGALGPAMLGIAGAVGDGVCLNLMPPVVVPRQREAVAAGAARAGRALPEHFSVMARLHVVPTTDVAAGRSMVRAAFGPYFGQPVYNRFLAWIGYPEEAGAIAAAFAAGNRDGVATAMHDRLVDDVALVGSPGRIRARLDEYAAAGLDVAALNVIAGSAAEVAETLGALAS